MASKRSNAGPSTTWRVLGLIAVLGAAGLGTFLLMLRGWSDVRTADGEAATDAIESALQEAGPGPAYVTIDGSGTVHVRRDLEGPEPVDLETLSVFAWRPAEERLVRVDVPFWFVRLKMNDAFNLGTLTALLVGDWTNLDLDVTEDDLMRRGPGLVLDQAWADGARLVLWTR
ncbi:MAG: hypothetical protein AAGI22_15545 [Planctomycetota bacterium]